MNKVFLSPLKRLTKADNVISSSAGIRCGQTWHGELSLYLLRVLPISSTAPTPPRPARTMRSPAPHTRCEPPWAGPPAQSTACLLSGPAAKVNPGGLQESRIYPSIEQEKEKNASCIHFRN